MLGVIGAALVTAAGALWIYLKREGLGAVGVGMAAFRTGAVALAVGLLLNPVRTTRDANRPPVILLDASLSMAAAGGHWDRALDTARALAGLRGTVLRFGDEPAPFDTVAPGQPASRLGPALTAAAALGGPVTVVTDGAIGDAAAIPSALRGIATTIVLPRDTLPDVALVDVRALDRIAEGDTLLLVVDARARGPDAAEIAVWEGERRLALTTVTFGGSAARRVEIRVPGLPPGMHRLRIVASAPGDAEPGTDERYRLVEVSALPAVTLVAAPAGWEATFLARELRDIVRAPVGGYAQLTEDRWIDLATQQPVSVERVHAAIRAAQLVVRVGPGVHGSPRPRVPVWDWSTGDPARRLDGEWYPSQPTASPLAGRLAGTRWDSLAPLSGVYPIAPEPGAWTGLSARRARRGAERPIVIGSDSAGVRRLETAGEGLWRWALRGGLSREAFRGLVAAGADWLLGSESVRDEPIVVASPVVSRGAPVVFRWAGDVVPDSVPTRFTTEGTERMEVLRFDASREARVYLAPGFWQWRGSRPAVSGTVAVEPYSPEFVASEVTVEAGPAAASSGTRTAGLREWWWLYLVIVALLLGEWGWRVRRGLP